MKTSKFSLSNTKLLSCDQGELVPIGLTEVLPGDILQQATHCLIRVSPLLAPVMHPVHARIHHWFVPHRLVWNDWENFITGGPDGLNASVLPLITFPQNGPEIGTLADYLGIPVDNPAAAGTAVSALPFRAYSLIWNEYYRDQDLETALTIDLTDGPDTTTNVLLQNVGWEKDYFTSARPWTQKGAAVTIPFGATAPVVSDNTAPTMTQGTNNRGFRMTNSDQIIRFDSNPTATADVTKWVNTGMVTDLASATAVSINDFREAFALQRYKENRARYGSRYVEYLRSLGIRSSDARLQRPEYLGGGKQVIQFSEVLQTAGTTGGSETGVGNIKGHGIGAMRSNRYRRFFEEHGYVISLLSVRPKTIYSTGIPKTFIRATKEDFFQKELQSIGQQEILNKEVYAPHATPNGVFGYQDRYDEYRRQESTIAGLFRSTLNFWHYARIFASDPTLNADFVKSVPTTRTNQVTNQDVLWVMANHSIQARRLVAPSGKSFIY